MFYFIANTPEELRLQIVEYLRNAAKHRASTRDKPTQHEAVAELVLLNMAHELEPARVVPKQTS